MKNYGLQLLLKMTKYLALGMLVQVFLFTLVLASESKAQKTQSVKEVYVELGFESVKLKKVFSHIESKTDFRFTIYENEEYLEKTFSLQRKKISVEDLLTQISRETGLVFQQINNNIGIKKGSRYELKRQERVEIIIQSRTVTGKVTSMEDDESLPGVNVVEKGTSNGTVTDLNGNYSLDVSEGATIVFSSVGYTTEEVEVGNRSTLDLVMAQDLKQLQELVVVGYGTQKRADITGSIAKVTEKEIQNIPVTAVDAMLQGKVAGVQVVQNSGAPGAANFVRIRGNNSLFGENRPLYVVDGVPMNEVTTNVLNAGGQLTTGNNDINPNDIESIEILKDASATAIYGSRASNGVVLITTKRGKSGKAKIEFNMYTGTQQVWRQLDVLNAQQYEDYMVESINNENTFRDAGNQIAIPDEIRTNGIDTDWQNEIFRTAPISNYNLSMSAGNDKTQYYTSLSYFDQKGTVVGQSYDRVTGRINIDHQATDKLNIGSNLTVSYSKNNRVFSDFDGRNPIGAALIARPNLPVFNDNGSYSQDQLGENFNPVQLTREIPFKSTQKRVIGNIFAEYNLLENLSIRTTWGIDNLSDRQERFIPNTLLGVEFAQANAAFYEELVWVIETIATYRKIINEDNDFSFMIGNTLQNSDENFLRTGGSQAGSNIVTTVNSISVPDLPAHEISQWGLVSYFGRLNYNYKDKFLLTGTLRADGSSRFPDGNKWGIFPSGSVGYRLSSEQFMQDLNFINDLKLRASYGVVGNQELGDNFPGRPRYNTGSNYTGSFPGINIGNIPNPNLSWESTAQTNIGLDLAMFNNRVNITADVYEKVTSDLIFRKNIPRSAGFFGNADGFNLGEVENRGLDLAISTVNIQGEFTWSSNFNINFNRNKIKSLPDFDPENPTATDFFIEQDGGFGTDGARSVYRVGEPIGSFYGWFVDGIDPATGGILYVDTNDDGGLGFDDRTIFGNAQPLHTGGFTNNFSYKGFDMNVFMQWSYGNDVYNQTGAVLEQMAGYNNQSTDILDRWQQPGDQTDVPIAVFNDVTGRFTPGANNTEISDRFLEDGSFLRVKDITLGYSLPQSLIDNVNISNVRIYGSVRNAFTFTNYTGFDPESQNVAAVTSIGIDYLTQPVPRTFILGIDVQF